ncbi:LytR family transcriptional attenuator [Planifilum fimeticola]|uniref:LytR family transcriptional attenuator n=2 Tax=Planifilum fimeticola TaxID=201975 RepID=A0A2T0LA10_9BACL|nr:LytR family transcriptional attenuator [Planifilum fimeticola]
MENYNRVTSAGGSKTAIALEGERFMRKAVRLMLALSVLLLFLGGIGIWNAHTRPPGRPKTVGEEPVRKQPDAPKPVLLDRPTTLLLIGVDQRRDDPGRTDALVLLTIHPRKRSVKILHVPRDTKVRLNLGKGRTALDKINHAYALGEGIPSTVQTLESFLDIPVDHYVKVNMKGFRKIIDLFGGVDVNSPRSFSYLGHHFRKGPMHLNGSQALAYIRDRTGTNDFDRHRRQQQVLRSLWHKSKHPSTLLKMNRLFNILRAYSETSLTLRDAVSLCYTLSRVPEKNIETIHFRGHDQWSSRYYFIVPEKERLRIRSLLRRHLELEA